MLPKRRVRCPSFDFSSLTLELGVGRGVLALILRAFGISIPYKLFTRGDLRSLKASATVF